jgi:hypothetical protein
VSTSVWDLEALHLLMVPRKLRYKELEKYILEQRDQLVAKKNAATKEKSQGFA